MAALSIAIEQARKRGASRESRENQNRAELRLEELSKVLGIPERFDRNDRSRAVAIESALATAYQLVDRPEEKDAILRAFQLVESDYKADHLEVREDSEGAVAMMARDNDVWLHGQTVPAEWLADGCGPTGRAA